MGGVPSYPSDYPGSTPASTAGAVTVHQIVDQQHGIVAVTFEIPPTWQAQSQLQWNFQNYSQPLKVFARTYDPVRPAMVEFFPIEQFYWVEPYLGIGRPGEESGGVIMMQPMSAADTMTRWVIPKYRGSNAQIINVRAVPNFAATLNNPVAPNAQSEGVCATVEYTDSGRAFEEEFYGLKVAYPGIPTYGAAGTLVQYNWGFERLFSFRAEKGNLAEVRATAWPIVHSIRVNPAWQQVHAQVLQQMQQLFDQYLKAGYAQIEAATQMSRQISAQNDAWLQQQAQRREDDYRRDQTRRQQEQTAGGSYTANDAFGDYIMGRETYNDPYYQGGSQHYGYYNYVWTDKMGNYQYSNDANYNPNVGGNRDWVIMEKKQIGG